VAGIPRPPTAADAGGTLLAASEAKTSEPATLPAEAWPCHLSTFHGASGGRRTEPSCKTASVNVTKS
jgi:hypothetical protein